MNFNNLVVGKKYKNYKELCEALEVKPLTSNSKKAQLKQINSRVRYHKEGYGFVIDKVKDIADEIEDGRSSGNNIKEFIQCKVKRDDWNSIGVYKITRDKEIYIGSTTRGFRDRFLGHTYTDNLLPTLEIIHNGGVFEIIEVCNDMTEDEIRKLERKYIRHYDSMSEKYTIINERGFNIHKQKKPFKYKIIKRFDTATGNMVTEYKQGNKLIHEERHKIDDDSDVVKMLDVIENGEGC